MNNIPNKAIISVLHAALIVYITECREVDDADGEMYARHAQAWLDDQARAQYSHRNGEATAPTETGYYWFRYDIRRERLLHLCEVRRDSLWALYAVWPGVDFQEDVDEIIGQWYGPIPEPEE